MLLGRRGSFLHLQMPSTGISHRRLLKACLKLANKGYAGIEAGLNVVGNEFFGVIVANVVMPGLNADSADHISSLNQQYPQEITRPCTERSEGRGTWRRPSHRSRAGDKGRRSEERRVGKEGVSTGRSRGSPYH